ncbi:MAG: hypothetical protein U5J64_00315 [Halobacteriales archaeon]|nr:hypothetical protein [Halobacteriales archaeon]
MVFERVRNLVGGGSDKETNSGGGESVVMPTDSKIIRKTAKEVDLSKGEVKDVVERFQEVGAMAYPVIDERAVRGDDDKSGKPNDDEGPSFLYVIHEDDDVLVIGGAKNIILTFAGRLNLTNTETRAVTTANRLAGNLNGFSEHIVMDDIFIVPKDGRSGVSKESLGGLTETKTDDDTSEEKEDRIQEVEENGFTLRVSDLFEEEPDLDDKMHFSVTYGCDNGKITLVLDPKASSDEPHHAVIHPDGEMFIPHEIAVGLGVKHREVEWENEDGKVVGRMGNGRAQEEFETDDVVRTTLAKDNVDDEVQAHLSGSHTSSLGIDVGDEVALYVEPGDDDFSLVLSPDVSNTPSDRTVEIKNIGTGTEMLCIPLPEEIAEILDVNDNEERQIKWGASEDRLVGTVVR